MCLICHIHNVVLNVSSTYDMCTTVSVNSIASFPCRGLLESLCYTLYDVLRPIVIHVNHLETLADLCGIFKVLKMSMQSHVATIFY